MGVRDQLRARKKREEVDLGTDDKLYVKTMSGSDRSDFMDLSSSFDEGDNSDGKKLARKNAALVSLSLVDESGDQIYTLDELDELLEDMESIDIDYVVKKSLSINKLTSEEQEGQEKN